MRGMNYDRMEELVSPEGPILKFKAEIEKFFGDEIKKFASVQVGGVYTGTAASEFSDRLEAASNKMQQLLDDILAECVNRLNEKKQEYAAQELKMKNSVE